MTAALFLLFPPYFNAPTLIHLMSLERILAIFCW